MHDKIEISPFDLWIMILDTIRYSIGRMSTAPGCAFNILCKYGHHLAKAQIRQIGKEIEAKLKIDDEHPGHIGWECDRNTWEAAAQWCRVNGEEETEER